MWFVRTTLPGVGYAITGTQRTEQEDALGTVLCTRYTTGNEVSRFAYDAFGNETTLKAGSRSDHRWGGKSGYETDDSTGMVMMGARYYVPVLGRFLTPDPSGQQGGMNLYEYCGNCPLVRVDPTGTQWLDDAANFFGGWGGALTFGLTGRIAQNINNYLGYGEFQYGGAYFAAGTAVGTIHSFYVNPFKAGFAAVGKIGGAAMGGIKIAKAAEEVNEARMAYLFGQATGTAKNVQRSVTMMRQLASIGIHDSLEGRTYVLNALYESYHDSRSILGVDAVTGSVIRETFIAGPNGLLKAESYWQGEKLMAVKLFGGKF